MGPLGRVTVESVEMSPRAEVETVGGGEVGLISDQRLDFELMGCRVDWTLAVCTALGSVLEHDEVPWLRGGARHRASTLCLINPLQHYEANIANVTV